jgi:hypothetical protein
MLERLVELKYSRPVSAYRTQPIQENRILFSFANYCILGQAQEQKVIHVFTLKSVVRNVKLHQDAKMYVASSKHLS